MKTKKSLYGILSIPLAVGALFAATVCFAGNGKGNGGDAIVCRNDDNTIRSTEFFDLFETREIYGKQIDLGDANLSLEKKIELLTSHIARLFPNLADKFAEHARTFIGRTVFTDSDLEDIPDAGEIIFPKGCVIEQTIIRGPVEHTTGKNFLINSRIWQRLDTNSKAAGISHEFFYGLAVDDYHKTDSSDARRLNAEFLSNPPPTPTELFDWRDLFTKLGLGFSENWGNLATWNYGNPIDENGMRKLQGHLTRVTQMPSTRLGKIDLAANSDYVFLYDPKTQHFYLNGTLAGPHTFKSDQGDWSVEGGAFDEIQRGSYGEQFFGLQLEVKGLTLPPLPSQPVETTFFSECGKFDGVVSLTDDTFFRKGSVHLSLRAVNPSCKISYSIPSESITMVSNGELGLSYCPHDPANYSVSATPAYLKWPYGEVRDLKTAVYFSPGSAGANDNESVGVVADLKVGSSHILNFAFKDISWDKQGRITNITPVYKDPVPNTVLIREGVQLSGRVTEPLYLDTEGKSYRGVKGDFKIVELNGFSKDYLDLGVTGFNEGNLYLRELPPAHIAHSNWIKSFNGDPTLPFDQTFTFPYVDELNPQWVLPLTLTGDLKIVGKDGKNEAGIWLSPKSYNASIELTFKGFMHFGRRRLLDNKVIEKKGHRSHFNIQYASVLRPEGLFVDDIHYKKENR